MKKRKPIGILGGMGPEASEYLYKTLINKAINEFGAKNNQDFPEIILHSIPVPDFISSDKDKSKALDMLKTSVLNFNKTDPLCLSIACNTAHLLLKDLQKISKTPFVSMIDEVIGQIIKDGKKNIGIVGTPTTIKARIYQKPLEGKGIRVFIPTEQQIRSLEKIIRNVIAGRILKSDSLKLKKVTDTLRKQGAEGIVLGCTELPLVFPAKYSLTVYNSVEVLAIALLKRYYNKANI